MTDTGPDTQTSLAGLNDAQWLQTAATLVEESGYAQHLDDAHHALFSEEGRTLLVTFESLQGIRTLSEDARPLAWDMLDSHGWSSLCVISDGDTWFRADAVFAYIDGLTDDGFFDAFNKVIFYGAGPCAYAAAAFSVAAPGARAVLIQPQATLDPRVTEWDKRFADRRRLDFTGRYGFAPDMLEAAQKAYVLYDPHEVEDAMHAALFTRPNVMKLRLPFMGAALQSELLELDQLALVLELAARDALDTASFARVFRTRRDSRAYLRNLLAAVERSPHRSLLKRLVDYGVANTDDPRFRRKQRLHGKD